MIFAPADLTPEQRHERGTLRAACRNAVALLLMDLPDDMRGRAEQLADDAAQALRDFWQGVAS